MIPAKAILASFLLVAASAHADRCAFVEVVSQEVMQSRQNNHLTKEETLKLISDTIRKDAISDDLAKKIADDAFDQPVLENDFYQDLMVKDFGFKWSNLCLRGKA